MRDQDIAFFSCFIHSNIACAIIYVGLSCYLKAFFHAIIDFVTIVAKFANNNKTEFDDLILCKKAPLCYAFKL